MGVRPTAIPQGKPHDLSLDDNDQHDADLNSMTKLSFCVNMCFDKISKECLYLARYISLDFYL